MAERGSNQHSPRVDDAMAADTASLTRGAPVEARAQEWHQMEPPADGEPVPDAHTSPGDSDVEDRSRLAASLRPSAFPGDRKSLVDVAREQHADLDVIAWLEALPSGETYANVQAVWSALGHRVEERDHTPVEPAPLPAESGPPNAAPDGTSPGPRTAERRAEERSLIATVASVGTGVAMTGVGFAVQGAGVVLRTVRRVIRR